MTRLPVIVSFGGYNAAGRSSFHQSYRRMVIESLSTEKRQQTIAGLAAMMNLPKDDDDSLSVADIEKRYGQAVLDGTLIRRIGKHYFDIEAVPSTQAVSLEKVVGQTLSFELSRKQLPKSVPHNWQLQNVDDKHVRVTIAGDDSIRLNTHYHSPVEAAGQLPDGFDPAALYASRFHPRGLQLSIVGASDAVNAMGIEWEHLIQHVTPDEIGVYSTSVMSQLDQHGLGGLLQARLQGGRVTTKQLALGFASMPTDFINAYVLGSLGATGSVAGACASFLYNLKAGIEDIRSGRRRVIMVSSSEAPITPEIIDGYATMGALATTEKLCKLEGIDNTDLRRSSRPFGENCGFTIAESTQHVMLLDDELALELGANICGSVPDVFINADGYKKSISAPGPGNYLTFAKAVAAMRSLLGDEAIQQHSFIQAHGSSTPKNRVTESEIFDRVARAFDIHQWPIAAVKAYVGHSLAPASGDQLINALGIFDEGIVPGVKTIDAIAEDVLDERLNIPINDMPVASALDIAFLNSKGFGGNNATACVLSPRQTYRMLKARYGEQKITEHMRRNEAVKESSAAYNQAVLTGDFNIRYRFGQHMIDDSQLFIDKHRVSVPSYQKDVDLHYENDYKDMTQST